MVAETTAQDHDLQLAGLPRSLPEPYTAPGETHEMTSQPMTANAPESPRYRGRYLLMTLALLTSVGYGDLSPPS